MPFSNTQYTYRKNGVVHSSSLYLGKRLRGIGIEVTLLAFSDPGQRYLRGLQLELKD